jgi:hypothetical protein
MQCDICRKSLTEYLTGQMNAETRESVESHLKGCKACRQQMERLSRTWDALVSLPDEEPSPELKKRFTASLEEAKRGLRTRREVRERKPSSLGETVDGWFLRLLPQRPAFQAGLALAMLVFGITLGTVFHSRVQRNGELTMLREEISSMRQTVTLSLLDRPASTDRLRAVQYSKHIERPSEPLLSALLETLRSDPNVNVRLAAVDALYLFRNEAGVREALVDALSEEGSPLVQIAVIDLLVGIREERALQILRDLIEDREADPAVKAHARDRIGELS